MPVQQRIENVRDFLRTIDCTLVYEIVPIQDAFGPTKSDPNLQTIVVSRETFRGGEAVNERRAATGLGHLNVQCIELVEPSERDASGMKEAKVSSSNQRMDLLGQRLREPSAVSSSLRPYVVAIAGAPFADIATIVNQLKRLGAASVDCDQIKADNGKDDCRSASLRAISAAGSDICILHGRLLSETTAEPRAAIAGLAHESWAVIESDKSTLARLTEQGRSADEASAELSSWRTNQTLVGEATTVLSTQWHEAYTREQVDKAWAALLPFVRRLRGDGQN